MCPTNFPPVLLSPKVRHHRHFGVKESLHNIAKHAQATEAWRRLKLTPPTLTLTVEDNGHGFQRGATAGKGPDGLGNLEARMEEIGGSFDPQSHAGQSPHTTLIAPLKQDH